VERLVFGRLLYRLYDNRLAEISRNTTADIPHPNSGHVGSGHARALHGAAANLERRHERRTEETGVGLVGAARNIRAVPAVNWAGILVGERRRTFFLR
jgi:hypothetical protein